MVNPLESIEAMKGTYSMLLDLDRDASIVKGGVPGYGKFYDAALKFNLNKLAKAKDSLPGDLADKMGQEYMEVITGIQKYTKNTQELLYVLLTPLFVDAMIKTPHQARLILAKIMDYKADLVRDDITDLILKSAKTP